MRALGERILQVLVAYESDGLYSGSTWLGSIAKKTSGGTSTDGRKIAPTLRRLEDAGLVERDPARKGYFRPTERGRKVDGILDRVVVERGGSFVPWSHTEIEPSEAIALHYGENG